MQISNENRAINRSASPKPPRDSGLDLCSIEHRVVHTSLAELARRDQEVDRAAADKRAQDQARIARGRELYIEARGRLEAMKGDQTIPEIWIEHYHHLSAVREISREMGALNLSFGPETAKLFTEKRESLEITAGPARFQAALHSKDELAGAIDSAIFTNTTTLFPRVTRFLDTLPELIAKLGSRRAEIAAKAQSSMPPCSSS